MNHMLYLKEMFAPVFFLLKSISCSANYAVGDEATFPGML